MVRKDKVLLHGPGRNILVECCVFYCKSKETVCFYRFKFSCDPILFFLAQLYLILFAYILLSNFTVTVSWYEWFLLIWVISFLLEEIREVSIEYKWLRRLTAYKIVIIFLYSSHNNVLAPYSNDFSSTSVIRGI